MKLRNSFKRFISVSAMVAVLLSSASIMTTVNAEDAGIIKDDFSSSSYTSGVWTAVDTDTKAESSVTAENGLLKTASGTKTVTAVNNANWEKMTVTENRRLESFRSYVTPKQAGEIGVASPVLYFNPNTGDYVYLLLYKHSNYGWQISYGLNGSGRKNNNMLYGGQAYLKEATNMIFEANYSYSDGNILNSITAVVYYYKNNSFADADKLGALSSTLTFTGAAGANDVVTKGIDKDSVTAVANGFKAGFKGGSDEATTAKTEISRAEFTFSSTIDEQAAAFRSKYSAVLSKTAENVTAADIESINTAVNEYSLLPDGVKSALTQQYAALINLKKAVYKTELGGKYNVKNSVFDDFESHTEKSLNYVYSFAPSSKLVSKVADSKIVEIDGNKWFAPYAGANGYTAVDDALWLDRTLVYSSFDVFVPEAAQGSSGSQLVYTYYDTAANAGIGFDIYREKRDGGNGIMARVAANSKFSISKGSRNLYLAESDGWSCDKPINVTASYVLTNESEIRVIMKLIQGEKSTGYDFTFTCKDDYRYQQSGFKVAFAAALEKSVCYFDNLSFTFALNNDDKAQAYKEKYSGILSKTPSTLTESDKTELLEALKEFSALEYETQVLLSAENSVLRSLAAVIDPSVNDYMNKYGALLSTDISALDHSYDTAVDNAIADYESLSEIGKLVVSWNTLYKFKSTLRNMLETVGANYDAQNIDFEYDYFPFVENANSSISPNSFCGVIDDPTDETGKNKVLSVWADSNDNIEYVINDKIWPTNAQLKTLKFKMYFDGGINAFALSHFMYSYVDEENFNSMSVSGGGAGKSRFRYGMTSGGESAGGSWLSSAEETDLDGWLEVSLTFGKTNVSGSVKNLTSEKAIALNMPYIAGAKIGFKFYSTWNNKGNPWYLDDIRMTFERGDFDSDLNVTDANIYYTGNSFIKEDETLLLTGESLGNIADKLYIYRVNDEQNENPAFVKAGNFETTQVGKPVVSVGSDYAFDYSRATELDIVQRTKTSIKAVIPEGLSSADGKTGSGVYAVNIVTKSGSSKTLLVNAPLISFVTGDEGGISTVGSELEIVGYNLCPTGNAADVSVIAKNVSNGALTRLNITELKQNDMYYIKTSLGSLKKGTYEVFVHSGYGDNLCWSAPYELVIGDSPRDKWSKRVFKVEDYGAVGDAETNCTAAVINALNDAYKNGGGIVEFGEGIYRVETTLPIPLNTVLKGQGSGYTTILYTAYKWQYGEAEDLLSFIGNFAIEGIHFAATRVNKFVVTNKSNAATDRLAGAAYGSQENDNIYFNDVRFRSLWREGQVTGGGGGFAGTGKYTVAELLGILNDENSSTNTVGSNSTNVRMTDVDIMRDGGQGNFSVSGDYLYVDGYKVNMWNMYNGHNAFVVNLEATGATAVESGHGYFADSYLHSTTTNNRELFTTDGGARATDVKIRFIGDNPELMEYYTGSRTTNGKAFAFVGNTPGDNSWQNLKLLVTAGQGMGQIREITSNTSYTAYEYEFDITTGKIVRNADGTPKRKLYKADINGKILTDPETGNPIPSTDGTGVGRVVKYYWFTVDTEFAVNPNRNSNCYIVNDRDNTILVNNKLEEGNAGAIYGAGVNWVFDNYSFDRCAGPALTNRASIIWYVTFKDFVMTNPQSYVHGEGHGGTSGSYQTGNGAIRIYAQTAPCAFAMVGITVKNCDMGGYRFNVSQASISNCLWDLVIEKNSISGAQNAIRGINDGINGCIIRANDFEVKEQMFTSDFLNNALNKVYTYNTQHSPRAIVWLNSDGSAVLLLGDANGDGKISLKDASFVRYYYHGMITATDEQIKRMDVNEDGKVNLKDINQIKRYIIDGTPFEKYVEEPDTSSDTSSTIPDPDPSEPSSSEPSSSEPSSSESSSSEESSSDIPYFPGHY